LFSEDPGFYLLPFLFILKNLFVVKICQQQHLSLSPSFSSESILYFVLISEGSLSLRRSLIVTDFSLSVFEDVIHLSKPPSSLFFTFSHLDPIPHTELLPWSPLMFQSRCLLSLKTILWFYHRRNCLSPLHYGGVMELEVCGRLDDSAGRRHESPFRGPSCISRCAEILPRIL
jgi:hypothetical protein